jgi:putative addiction module component (TIGR02574 family)
MVMSRNAAQLLHEALELPSDARAALADSLLDSLDVEVDHDAEQAWHKEIEQRLASIDDGTVKLISWDDAQAQLLHKLKR